MVVGSREANVIIHFHMPTFEPAADYPVSERLDPPAKNISKLSVLN